MQAVNDVKDREESATPSPPRPTRQVLSCDTKDLQFLALTRPCLYDQTLSSSFSSHTLTLSRTHYLSHTHMHSLSHLHTRTQIIHNTSPCLYCACVEAVCACWVGWGGGDGDLHVQDHLSTARNFCRFSPPCLCLYWLSG